MKKAIAGVFALLIFCTAAYGRKEPKPNYKTGRDISYRAEGLDRYADSICRLDIYYPADVRGFATVIWFHGGGLTGGHRIIPEECKDKGLAVVTVDYRLSPRASVPEILDDAAAAVHWTFSNISGYGGTPSKIYLAGHSAGAYLVSMVGLDKGWLRPYGLDPDTAFRALIPYSGNAIAHFKVREAKGIPIERPLVDNMAPMFHVRPDCPPILILSGDRELEMVGRYEENAFFWRLFQVVGHPDARIMEFDGFGHSDMVRPGHMVALKYIMEMEKRSQGDK